MTRFELIQKLVEEYPHLCASDVERTVAAIFDEIATALSRGDRVELCGFGTLVTKKRQARQGRNRGQAMILMSRRTDPLLQDWKTTE